WRVGRQQRVRAHALAQAGQFAAALDIARDMTEPWHRNWALAAIARALVRAGQLAAALDTARRITEEWFWTDALAAVAQAQLPLGEFAAALADGGADLRHAAPDAGPTSRRPDVAT
ncbi:MAG: hypothetical protein ACREQ3_09920, partial [Candidatus Binatia bacterium]